MAKSTRSQRKHTPSSNKTSPNLQVNQQHNYHLGSSEIDALGRMQNEHPDLVERILNLREQELNTSDRIVGAELKEQELRSQEIPYLRRYAFLGQCMAYSIGIGSLVGGAYFGIIGNNTVAGLFLTSTVGIAFAQFWKSK